MRFAKHSYWLFSIFIFTLSPLPAQPLHLHFMELSDIREPQNVEIEAHPFTLENSRVLLDSNDDRPSLWRMPTDVIKFRKNAFVLFYQRVEKDLENYLHQRTWCLGYVKPGLPLMIPPVDEPLEPSWPFPDHVVLQRSLHKPTWGGFNVFQIVPAKDEGWNVLYWDQPPEGEAGGMIASSQNLEKWDKRPFNKAVFTEHNDAYSLIKKEDHYLLYQTRLLDWPEKPFEDNLPGKRRSLSLRVSPDLIQWSSQEDILVPDEFDAPTTEFYLMKVFPYADRYLGIVMKYYADPTQPKKHSGILKYELVVSADGHHWDRPFRETNLTAWSYASPFVMEDKFCMAAHHDGDIRLYWLRKDGLVSCGTEGEGTFWTKGFTFPEGDLNLNADCSSGSIRVEVIDERGVAYEGLEKPILVLENQDAVDLALDWPVADRDLLKGKKVHLKFTLSNARVYSLYEDRD